MIYTFIIRELQKKKKIKKSISRFEITGLWHIYQISIDIIK